MSDGSRTKPHKSVHRAAAGWCSRYAAALLIAVSAHLASVSTVRAQPSAAEGEVQFDIPSQPLAAALRAYGKATGLEVFYDGSLAVGRRSAAIQGVFTPMRGLQKLLQGTGYVPRATEITNTVTIVGAPAVAPLRATFDRYEPYFAALQARLSEALCDSDEAADFGAEIRFRFWVDPLGAISNAELLAMEGSDAQRSAIASKVRGLRIGKTPPAGLPQPVTMIIYPPSVGEAGCPPASSRHARN